MHRYEDNDFKYFNEVDKAADEIGDFCRKWGRIQVNQTKEKYGTVRVYCSITCNSLHELIHPGWYRVGKPYKLLTFPLFPNWFLPLIFKYQSFIYRKAYERAVKKYPMIKKEILQFADFDELLQGL